MGGEPGTLAEETVSAETWQRNSCGAEAGWGPGSLGASSRELGSPGGYVRGGRLWSHLPACLAASTPPRPAVSFLPPISGDSSQAGMGQ